MVQARKTRGVSLVRSSAAICVCALLALGTSAHAGDAVCLWRNLPADLRESIIVGYAQGGSQGLANTPITNDLVRGLVGSCSGREPSENEARAAGVALAGQALAEAAATELGIRFGIGPATLSSAWSDLSRADRSLLLGQFAGLNPGPEADAALFGVVRDVALTLRWRGPADQRALADPEFKTIADYVTGRAQASAFDASTSAEMPP